MIGVDLLDFWRGTLTPRKLGVLIRHLPVDSAFIRAALPDAAATARWSPTAHVLADLYDLTAIVHKVADKRTGKPVPSYPRPQDVINARNREEARAEALLAQRRRLEERQRQRGQADPPTDRDGGSHG